MEYIYTVTWADLFPKRRKPIIHNFMNYEAARVCFDRMLDRLFDSPFYEFRGKKLSEYGFIRERLDADFFPTKKIYYLLERHEACAPEDLDGEIAWTYRYTHEYGDAYICDYFEEELELDLYTFGRKFAESGVYRDPDERITITKQRVYADFEDYTNFWESWNEDNNQVRSLMYKQYSERWEKAFPASYVKYSELEYLDMKEKEGESLDNAEEGEPFDLAEEEEFFENSISVESINQYLKQRAGRDKAKEREVVRNNVNTGNPVNTEEAVTELTVAAIGSIVEFGNYIQGTNEQSDKIKWKVLDKQEDRLLLFSLYGLENKEYNEQCNKKGSDWEYCSLRQWLNDEFLHNAFTQTEQDLIENTIIAADRDTENNDTNKEKTVTDKVFLISESEADKYFPSAKEKICYATAALRAQGDTFYRKCMWWLRSSQRRTELFIDMNGNKHRLRFGKFAIRPAIWIKLKEQ